MSIEGVVPSARSQTHMTARAAVLVMLLLAAGCRNDTAEPYVALSAVTPEGGGTAEVRVDRCGTGWCEGLWVGPSSERAVRVTLLSKGERCDEIAWTKDGKRVAFLVDGHQLWIFDAAKQAPAGRVNLVERDAQPTSRVARGVTFSANGAAITFDDCPRGRSGCKPGMIAIRQ
jgi:hypothetical protein